MTKKSFALLVLAIIFAVVVAKALGNLKGFDSDELKALDVKLEPLRTEKNRIEGEINLLQTEYDDLVNGTGNLIFMFKDVNNKLYTEIKDELTKRDMIGTILLSKEEFPGQKDCMTMSQFKEMIDMGWKYYINWEAGEDKEEWLSYWTDKMNENGLEMPKVVHFETDAYSENLDSFLTQNGFEVLIHQGIRGSIFIVMGCEEEPWDICTAAWNDLKAKNLMQQAVSEGGTLVFAIGSKKDAEQYSDSTFETMISTLSDYVKRDRIHITDVLSAKTYEKDLAASIVDEKEALAKQIEEMKTKLKEVEEQMDTLYKEYKEKEIND